MFELLDLSNLWVPGNRREVAILLGTLSLFVTVVLSGVFVHEAGGSSAPLAQVYLSTPGWLRWGIVIAPAICIGAVALYVTDVAAERELRKGIGTWPRRPPHGAAEARVR